MGYTTDFEGEFTFNKPLDDKTFGMLHGLANTRRMKRQGLDPKYGVDGEFYFDLSENAGYAGQDDKLGVVDYNKPPSTQPGLWLQWEVTKNRKHLKWNGAEKFYNYVEWLVYLIEKVIDPNGFTLEGMVTWQGEDEADTGTILVRENVVGVDDGTKRIANSKEFMHEWIAKHDHTTLKELGGVQLVEKVI